MRQTCRSGFRSSRASGGRARTADLARRRHLRGLHRRNPRCPRPALRLCADQLHALRAAAQHRPRRSPMIARRTTMAPFALCAACDAEYRNPDDRRFHAEPIGLPRCGPKVTCRAFDGAASELQQRPDRAWQRALMRRGEIVAVKGLGGYQLACDATEPAAVETAAHLKKARRQALRADGARSRRSIRQYAAARRAEEQRARVARSADRRCSAAGPGVLPQAVAPGLSTLGLHAADDAAACVAARRPGRPAGDDERQHLRRAADRSTMTRRPHALAAIASHVLMHDRADRQPGGQFGGPADGGHAAAVAARARLRAGADRAAARFRERPRHPGDRRRAEGDVLPDQGWSGDAVAASGRS